jgi:hypothetical protein
MRYLEVGQTSSCSLPLLEVFTLVNGLLVDVAELGFTVFDASGAQVNASQPARDVLDPTVDCPVGPRKGVGWYAANFTVPVSPIVLGTYTINWYWKETALSEELSTSIKFEVVSAGALEEPLSPYYLSLAKLREEGVTEEMASDARALGAISMASRQVEMWLGRFFEPRAATYHVRGSGKRRVLLDQPIIAISEVRIATSVTNPPTDTGLVVDRSSYRTFNRHLTEGLLSPDDRDNPHLGMITTADVLGWDSHDRYAQLYGTVWGFPSGPQNVEISGIFGYTDNDGSLYGRTPRMLQHALALLVMRYLPKLTDSDARDDVRNRWRLVSETTREQSYKLGEGSGRGGAHHTVFGALTGDPEIDNTLIMFMRPPRMGAV